MRILYIFFVTNQLTLSKHFIKFTNFNNEKLTLHQTNKYYTNNLITTIILSYFDDNGFIIFNLTNSLFFNFSITLYRKTAHIILSMKNVIKLYTFLRVAVFHIFTLFLTGKNYTKVKIYINQKLVKIISLILENYTNFIKLLMYTINNITT